MSKVQEAKDKQGWTKKAPKCENCNFVAFDEVSNEYGYTLLKNIRCTFGGFATKVTFWCEKWERKQKK